MGPLDVGLSAGYWAVLRPCYHTRWCSTQHSHLSDVQGLFSGTDSPIVFVLLFVLEEAQPYGLPSLFGHEVQMGN